MLTQDVVLALLEASITGAGLVLAVYALIIPLSRRLFESFLEDFFDTLEVSKQTIDNFFKNKLDKESVEKLDNHLMKILESVTYPMYLRFGVGATFFGYTITTLLSLSWIVDLYKSIADYLLVPLFALSTILFLFVGIISIKDIHKTMKEDFNELLKRLKENENQSRNGM